VKYILDDKIWKYAYETEESSWEYAKKSSDELLEKGKIKEPIDKAFFIRRRELGRRARKIIEKCLKGEIPCAVTHTQLDQFRRLAIVHGEEYPEFYRMVEDMGMLEVHGKFDEKLYEKCLDFMYELGKVPKGEYERLCLLAGYATEDAKIVTMDKLLYGFLKARGKGILFDDFYREVTGEEVEDIDSWMQDLMFQIKEYLRYKGK